jgi:hypothetical protein
LLVVARTAPVSEDGAQLGGVKRPRVPRPPGVRGPPPSAPPGPGHLPPSLIEKERHSGSMRGTTDACSLAGKLASCRAAPGPLAEANRL